MGVVGGVPTSQPLLSEDAEVHVLPRPACKRYGAAEAAAAELQERALAWIAANQRFEATYSGAKLKPATCPVLPFLYSAALTDDDYGLNFSRPLHQDSTVADVQESLDFMFLGLVTVPGLEVAEDWRVGACPSTTSFKNGQDGQHIRITSFDGEHLRWTVDVKEFSSISGQKSGGLESVWRAHPGASGHAKGVDDWPGATSGPAGVVTSSYFKACGAFQGLLHFDCSIRLDP
mmetsp:Transcript_68141/g.121447  ORF Transcript_68141/g.121447 Transcript_68141/m.121447 type:complete len:232 (+) Transcript_68141:26-721(+)